MKQTYDSTLLLIPMALVGFWFYGAYSSLAPIDRLLVATLTGFVIVLAGLFAFYLFSPWAKENRKR